MMMEGYKVTERTGEVSDAALLEAVVAMPDAPTSIHTTLPVDYTDLGITTVALGGPPAYYLLNYNHRDDPAYNIHVVERC